MANDPKDVVAYTFNVSENAAAAKAKRVSKVSLTYDFNGVSRSALITMAIRSFSIALQSKMRAMTTRKDKPLKWAEVVKATNGQTINVAEALTKQRTRLSPAARIAKVAAKQSPDDIKAAIAMLQASLKPEPAAKQ